MKIHILLVEPDAKSAAHFRDSISFSDARVTIAHSDVDAVTLLQAGVQPEIALIVWGEDSFGSLGLIRQLREFLPALPVLLVLQEGEKPLPDVSTLGIQGVINKPFFFPTLPGILQKAMDEAAESMPASSRQTTPGEGEGVAHSLAAMLDRSFTDQPLAGHVELTQQQLAQLSEKLRDMSQTLAPVALLLSQDGALISHVGNLTSDSAGAMARLAGRLWREGATSPARECLCFKDQIPGAGTERRTVALFSVIVAGDLTLTVPWDGNASFSTLRTDTLGAAAALGSLLS
jgi:DNA-binding response OmpR family regulator